MPRGLGHTAAVDPVHLTILPHDERAFLMLAKRSSCLPHNGRMEGGVRREGGKGGREGILAMVKSRKLEGGEGGGGGGRFFSCLPSPHPTHGLWESRKGNGGKEEMD